MADGRRSLRCAIYTRKSSEEGLEQDFNSLDAQHEACAAYIASQRHEGWKPVATRYADGGFSGGNLDRPALQRLLGDIQSGLVDLVVVYKIDRLTRSLADFAKMVEVFDAHNASFVSVTQHFNTTTSMGRLTLNVLLSFAQFERELTGERIRDKIAASKQKGMWMGGTVPLGYDAIDRKLVVNPEEAEVVREIYRRYVALGDVTQLQAELRHRGIVSKRRVSREGKVSGGIHFFRGALYLILKNRVYLGEIAHREKTYPGTHAAIVDRPTWDAVQVRLVANAQDRRRGVRAKEASLLAGLVFDGEGRRLIPSHANKKGKRYRYYVVRDAGEGDGYKPVKLSVPAHDLESTVMGAITYWLRDVPRLMADLRMQRWTAARRDDLIGRAQRLGESMQTAGPVRQRRDLIPILHRIVVGSEEVTISLHRHTVIRELVGDGGANKIPDDRRTDDEIVLRVQASLQRSGLEMKLVVAESWASQRETVPDATLVKAVARAHRWMRQLQSGERTSLADICRAENIGKVYVRRILRCAALAPEMVEAILEGRQPQNLTLLDVMLAQPPLLWAQQDERYGSPTN